MLTILGTVGPRLTIAYQRLRQQLPRPSPDFPRYGIIVDQSCALPEAKLDVATGSLATYGGSSKANTAP